MSRSAHFLMTSGNTVFAYSQYRLTADAKVGFLGGRRVCCLSKEVFVWERKEAPPSEGRTLLESVSDGAS